MPTGLPLYFKSLDDKLDIYETYRHAQVPNATMGVIVAVKIAAIVYLFSHGLGVTVNPHLFITYIL